MATASAAKQSGSTEPILIDLGRHKRKRVRRLRKGRGKLMSRVARTHNELREKGICDPDAQTIIVVVREKKRRRRRRMGFGLF